MTTGYTLIALAAEKYPGRCAHRRDGIVVRFHAVR